MQEYTDNLLEFQNKLGYICQLPNSEGNYFYLVKQTNEGARQIFIKVGKRSADIEILANYKKDKPDKKEEALIEKLLLEDLGISEYQYI